MAISGKPVGYRDNSFPALSEREGLQILKDCFRDVPEEHLLKALNQSKVDNCYNIELAMNWLLDNRGKQAVQFSSSDGFKDPKYSVTTKREWNPSAQDISGPGRSQQSDDIQKAIQASLQTASVFGGQVSLEEQELSRIIEASIAEKKKVEAANQTNLFLLDPVNPHERKRIDITPVGLKNVGNSCWFSVITQALYYLPSFRRCIFNLRLDENKQSVTHPEIKLEFVAELRRLFALLSCSRRKYVDPSRVVDVLRRKGSLKLNNDDVDNQQDVSEFTHFVLEWVEEAFNVVQKRQDDVKSNLVSSASADVTLTDNFIQQLFYGSILIERVDRDGGDEDKEERFSQYPLQVAGFDNLHDSLESSLLSGEFDQPKSSLKRWFNFVPPVLIFQLNRFSFNQGANTSEKIHSRFAFPDVLYIDRYMLKNKDVANRKNLFVKKLKERLKNLQNVMLSYEEYGETGGTKVSLLAALNCVLRFCSNGDPLAPETGQSFESPEDVSCGVISTEDKCESESFALQRANAEETIVVKNCLTIWRSQVESKLLELKTKISCVENEIDSAYDDEIFKNIPYSLHAVLVHEGQAATGHYFMYLRGNNAGLWKKFNDVQVTESSWDDLKRECFGGCQNVSAYCLFYVRADRTDLHAGAVEALTVDEALPADLRLLVQRDNDKFDAELARWDADHPTPAPLPASPTLPLPPPSPPSDVVAQNLDLSGRHFANDLDVLFCSAANKTHDWTAELKKLSSRCYDSFELFVKHPDWSRDPRIFNVAFYAIGFLLPERLDAVLICIIRDLCVQLLKRRNEDRYRSIIEILESVIKATEEEQRIINEIHTRFYTFCSSVILMSHAVENFFQEKFVIAMKYVLIASKYTEELLLPDYQKSYRALNIGFIRTCAAKILEKWSVSSYEFYVSSTSESDFRQFIVDYEQLFLPTINKILLERSEEYRTLAEDIRKLWFALLQNEEKLQQISDEFRPALVELLSKLRVLPSAQVHPPAMTARCKVTPSVSDRFAECVRKADAEWTIRWT